MPRSAARATNSTSPSRVCAITGPGRVLDGLGDQRERVLVVLVHDDDREVRVLGGDQLDRLGDRDDVRRDLVAELLEHAAERRRSASLVLVGDQHAQVPCRRSRSSVSHGPAVDCVAVGPATRPTCIPRPCAPARTA